MELTQIDINRYWSKVDVRGENDCWFWVGGKCSAYGRLRIRGTSFLAHRIAWTLANGPIPEGLIVRHKVCDNPLCQNPRHLRIGTQADNMKDKAEAGRAPKGANHPLAIHPERRPRRESHGHAKITQETVDNIKADYATGAYTQNELARKYNISQSHVSAVVNGRRWKEAA